jgi:phasin family protein
MANTAQTAKATADRIADAGSKAFKDGVDKSLAAMADMNVQSKLNIEAVTASVTAATKGAESLGAQVVAYAKKSAEDNTAAMRSLSSAKSLQEAIELQTSFAKSAMEAYLAEMSRWSETVASSVKESMRPINERTSAVVQQFQTAR